MPVSACPQRNDLVQTVGTSNPPVEELRRDNRLSHLISTGNAKPTFARNECYVENLPYMEGEFSGTVIDGVPYDGEIKNATVSYKTKFSGEIKHRSLCETGRPRLQRPNSTTPFQELLESTRDPDEATRALVLYGTDDYVPQTTEDKFDITNDNARRVFDSYFAKHLISNTISTSFDELRQFSDRILAAQSAIAEGTDTVSDWTAACNGTYSGYDGRLQQLVTQMERARDGISTLDLPAPQKELLVDLYARRYLNYLIRDTDVYKSDHPSGVLKSHSNPLYFKRGRLDGPFRTDTDSLHMGILRNVDCAPADLRFNDIPEKKAGIDPSIYTRCPDRLNMADPSSPIDKDPDSWLTYNFSRRMTPFVNGLSGSMLIEMQSILYTKDRLKSDPATDFIDSPELLNEYLKSIACLYVLIDGGHSLFEIKSSFDQTWVKTAFVQTFEGKEWGSVGQTIYDDMDAFKGAFRDTQLFHEALKAKKSAHAMLGNIFNAEKNPHNLHTGISINGENFLPLAGSASSKFADTTLQNASYTSPVALELRANNFLRHIQAEKNLVFAVKDALDNPHSPASLQSAHMLDLVRKTWAAVQASVPDFREQLIKALHGDEKSANELLKGKVNVFEGAKDLHDALIRGEDRPLTPEERRYGAEAVYVLVEISKNLKNPPAELKALYEHTRQHRTYSERSGTNITQATGVDLRADMATRIRDHSGLPVMLGTSGSSSDVALAMAYMAKQQGADICPPSLHRQEGETALIDLLHFYMREQVAPASMEGKLNSLRVDFGAAAKETDKQSVFVHSYPEISCAVELALAGKMRTDEAAIQASSDRAVMRLRGLATPSALTH